MAYSPSSQTAWESVYFIQYEMQGGWLLRGVHHFTAQAMVVLLVLHLMQVVIDGAYRAPREVNFWLGLVLMQIVLGLSLTGYLLPWDQKGYWATRVATNLMGMVPFVGGQLQQLVVGGPDYGHHTLTRFFALHAGVLPALLVFFLVLHVYMFRRHGICHKEPGKRPECMFWPEQVLKDAVACLAVLSVVLLLVILPAIRSWNPVQVEVGQLGELGAELGAPADPADEYSAARPEWYFLFLFQMLKYFKGSFEIVGALVVPALVMLLLFAMPIVGRWKLGHRFNIGFLLTLIGGVGLLTWLAWRDDHLRPESEAYLKAVVEAGFEAERARELAQAPAGIPSTGAVTLMRNDPKTQGRKLFVQKCASCHGKLADHKQPDSGAPDLLHFASRQWLTGLLSVQGVAKPEYFGNTKHRDGDMADFLKSDEFQDWQKKHPEELESVIFALSAEAQLKSQNVLDARDAERIKQGRKLIGEHCAACHRFHDKSVELGTAPDLTGYGGREWILGMVAHPADKRFYGDKNDRMPSFGKQETAGTLRLTADYLRGDWYEPDERTP